MEQMNSRISIIVPIYNVEAYLQQCLESLQQQTYTNLEIVCVNDGSTDGSHKILEEFAKKDERIRLFQKENEGVSQARNMALHNVTGDYIMFVDSDDWIEPDNVERALAMIQQTQADIVMWSYRREFLGHSSPKIIFERDDVFEGSTVQEKLQRRMIGLLDRELSQPENADALCTIWGKLYRAELILGNRIQFYDIRKIGTYEDGLFNLEVLNYAQKVVFTNQYWYHYRKTNESSLTRHYKEHFEKHQYHLFEYMSDYIKEKTLAPEFDKALSNRICLSIVGLSLNELASPDGISEQIKNIRSILHSQRYKSAFQLLQLKYFPFHWKMFFYCCKHRLIIAVYILARFIQLIIGK